MDCILCLERIKTPKTHINIFSKLSQSQNVVQIIKTHFWIEPDPKKHKFMCKSCWTSLSNFHEFYTSIQKSHGLLEETVLANETKSQEAQKESTIADGVLKRRRGLPRCGISSNQKQKKINQICKDSVNKMNAVDVHDDVNVKTALQANLNELVMKMTEDHWSEIKSYYETEIKEEYKHDELSSYVNENEVVILNAISNDEQHSLAVINAIEEKPISEITIIKSDPNLIDNLGASDPIEAEQTEQDEQKIDINLKDTDNLMLDLDEEYNNPVNEIINIKAKPKAKVKSSLNQVASVSTNINEFIAQNFILNCNLCGETKDCFASLKSHFRIDHKIRGYAYCCGKKLSKRCVLVDHINFHLDPKYFQCTRCEKVLCDRRSLEKHKEGHDDKKERIFQCNTCTKSFYRRCVFERHLLLHLPEEQKTIPCPKCEKTFATNYIMNQHLKLVHLNLYAKVCDICGKFIRGRGAMERHTLEHAGIQPTMVQCELCGISLTNKYGLARHIKVRHTEEFLKPQVCTFCSKVSPNLSAHQRHVKYMHCMQRKHACPMCEKAFRRATDLKEHLTTHTGEVLYTCPHCPKTFNSNANMYAHRKRAHPIQWAETRQSRYSIKESAAKATTVLSQALAAAPSRNSISPSTKEE